MEYEHGERTLAVNEQYGWRVAAAADGGVDLELQRERLRLSEGDLRTLAWLTVAASVTRGACGLLSRATEERHVWRCHETGIWTLTFDETVLRLGLCEFLSLAGLCRAAVNALGPVIRVAGPALSAGRHRFSAN